MTANQSTTTADKKVDGTDYKLDLDSHREVLFYKAHDDGRRTQVHIEGRTGEWPVTAMTTRGDEELGHADIGTPPEQTKAAGKELAREWMRAHPEGVTEATTDGA